MDGSAEFYDAVVGTSDAPTNSTAVRVLLHQAAEKLGAVCIDGSPGAYYYRRGSGDGATKWYIHQQGGGWCESDDDCLDRSKTRLGSSKGYPPEQAFEGSYFSSLPSVNPMMYNWNMVHLNYCDGGSFSGNNETVTWHKGKPLHYRGKRVREAVFASLLNNFSLGVATDVVISGCSAGGLATFLHTDAWCDAIAAESANVKCVGLPDSGFFLDYEGPADHRSAGSKLRTTPPGRYHAGLQWGYTMFNASAGVHQDCVAAHGTSAADPEYLCFFAEHTSPYIHTPIFALQATYDSWQTSHVLPYPNTGADVNVLGANLTKRIRANLFGPHPQSGAFLDSCWHHCGMWDSIRIDGDVVHVAFARWYDGVGKPAAKTLWAQGQPYKCDKCCHPDEQQ